MRTLLNFENAIDDVIGGEPIGLIFQSQESE